MGRRPLAALLTQIALASLACSRSPGARAPAAEVLARQLGADLAAVRRESSAVAAEVQRIFSSGAPAAPLYPERKYSFYAGKLWYGGGEEGRGIVLATGFTPVDPPLIARARRLEHLEVPLKRLTEACPLVAMGWVALPESAAVFYPPFDVVAHVPPGLCVFKEILPYRAAAPTENPAGRPVWTEPYVDVTGKGYMITVGVPVRAGGVFLGVAGADVALEPVSERVSALADRVVLLLSRSGYVVAATPAAEAVTGLKALGDLYYLSQVQTDVPAPDTYLLARQAQAAESARRFADAVAGREPEVTLGGARYRVHAAAVPEVGWQVVELVPER
jgi:hypothetical protein